MMNSNLPLSLATSPPRPVLRIFGRVWRALLHLRFRTFQRHRHDRVVVEWVADRPILVLPQVMNPVLFVTGKFLAGVLSAPLVAPGATVLDMGTGSGICAIFAAQWARRIVAVDLNPAAVRCARINVLLHGLEERVEVREGDLFAPVHGERFDLILFNPPYLAGQPRTEFERALWSTDVIKRFAVELAAHLAENGSALVLLSSIAGQTEHLQRFRAHGFVIDVVARRNVLAEVLTVYRLRL
jgi:HemK-related putative methylase